MEEKIFIFGHKNPDTDSICSAMVKERFNRKLGYTKCFARRLGNVNKETQYVLDYLHLEAPEMIEEVKEGQEVILVDHNDFSQSADGIENAKIIGVIDHHRIANFRTAEPLYYNAKPYGCTGTILYKEYQQRNLEISKEEAILMASSIISDTLLLKSPTTTKWDKQALEELAKIGQIDMQQYGLEMLKAGTDLEDFTETELINLDAKNLEKDGKKFVIAQVNTVSIEEVLNRQQAIETAMEDKMQADNLSLFVFAITDILNSNSEIIVLGQNADEIIQKAFGKTLENHRAFLEGVVSRKKQLLPNIDKNI